MKTKLLHFLLLVPIMGAMASAETFLLSRHGSGRATAYSTSNKIISHEGKTHVTWLDTADNQFKVKIRTLDNATGTWSPSYEVGEAYDNHGGPALAIDQEGYLHIVYYAHHHPVRHRKSLRPNDASEWGPIARFGEALTYPSLVCAPDGTLIFAARKSYSSDGKNKPWEVEMWNKAPGSPWEKRGPIVRSRFGNYTHFHQSLAWSRDHKTLHLASIPNETPPESVAQTSDALRQWRLTSVLHMKSEDSGKTWKRWDGTPIELPGTAETMDRIVSARGDEGFILRGGALDVAPDGRPFVPWSLKVNREGGAVTAFVSHPDENGRWYHQQLNQFLPDGWPRDILGIYGGVSFDDKGHLHLSATLRSIWADPESEIVRFLSTDGGETFTGEIISPNNPSKPYWLPSIERRTGFNSMKSMPAIIYTGGEAGSSLKDILDNEVRFHR